MLKEKIAFFDTTLRDGEQSPGASLNKKEKLQIAKKLEQLNVDAIEAGFPIASPDDFESVKLIAKEIRGPIIVGLARSIKKDIDCAYEAVKYSKNPRIHVFLATSKVHRQYKLKKAKEEIIKLSIEAVKYAKKYVTDVEFSPEDASRTEPDFLSEVVSNVIEAGAKTINIPDTVGYATPLEFGALIKYLKENTPNIDKAVLSVHCHNDLGLAVANSLSAIVNGARQVECTINGIGERAGNASLEELVMILKVRKDLYSQFTTAINTKQIYKISKLVSNLTGLVVQRNKAIVGENAFSHESGIHQDGFLKERTTYEIMKPETIGLTESKLILGKHSGRHAFKNRLQKLGFSLNEVEVDKAFLRFKELADKKKVIYDEDLEAIVSEDHLSEIVETYCLDYVNITAGNTTVPTATVKLKKGKEILQDAAIGDGPVDAAYNTINRITNIKGVLEDYALRALTCGRDAMGEVTVKVKVNKVVFTGKASSTDIVEASVKAYLQAINKGIALENKMK